MWSLPPYRLLYSQKESCFIYPLHVPDKYIIKNYCLKLIIGLMEYVLQENFYFLIHVLPAISVVINCKIYYQFEMIWVKIVFFSV